MPLDVDSMTLSELVASAAALNDQITAKIAAYNDWAAGSATGGPEGDGRYPLPVLGDPGEVLLPGPARIAYDAPPFVVGLFGEIAGKTIPAHVDLIQTTGQDEIGKGAKVLARTEATGETAWRTQSADESWWEVIEIVPALWDFGWSNTDNGAAWDAANAWSAGTGRTLIVPGLEIPFVDVRDIAKNATIKGVGRGSVLRGPGFRCWGSAVDGGGKVTYENINITVRDVLFDGEASDVVASGRALDFLGGNFVTVEGCRFQGFKDQIVLDVVQRAKIHRNQFNASVGTRSGIWIPRGPEAHAGVDIALHPSNIISMRYNHFSWFNSTGHSLVDHGGGEHEFVQNQCSFGTSHARVGGVFDWVFDQNDSEFSSTWGIETVATNFDGDALASAPATLQLRGGYFDKPLNISNARGLVQTGIDYFISGQAAVQGVASTRMIRSVGCKNNRTGGTVLDALPGLSGASIFQRDEENFLSVSRDSAPVMSDTVGGVTATLAVATGSQRLEGKRDGVRTLVIDPANGRIRVGSRTEDGPNWYGGTLSPLVTNPGGSSPGDSYYFRKLAAGEAWTGQMPIYVKDNSGTWREVGKPPILTFAEASAAAPTAGARIFIADRANRPAYGDGSNWRWYADDAVIS